MRRYRLEDESLLFEAARESIREVYPFLPWCHPEYSIEDSRTWLMSIEPGWNDNQSWSFAILAREDGRFLGGAGLNSIDEHPVANLGYWIRSSETGRGFATEVSKGLARFGFDCLGLRRIEIAMSTQNDPSRKVAEKTGAILEGRLRNRLHLHGRDHDAWLYSLTPNDMMS